MNKEKSFAKELAELINRHSIDAKFNTADYLLADLAIDALNAYGKTKRKQEIRENPELDTCDCPVCQMRRALEAKEAARPKPGKKGIQETGGVRRSKRGSSNGGIFRRNVPQFQSRNTPGRNATAQTTG